MPYVEKNGGGFIRICRDEVPLYAGPGVRIFNSIKQPQEVTSTLKRAPKDLGRSISRPGSLVSVSNGLVEPNGLWARIEGMDS